MMCVCVGVSLSFLKQSLSLQVFRSATLLTYSMLVLSVCPVLSHTFTQVRGMDAGVSACLVSCKLTISSDQPVHASYKPLSHVHSHTE